VTASHGRPTPVTATLPSSTPPATAAPRETGDWQESFFAVLPLFLVGAVCIVLAVYLYYAGASTTFGGSSAVHLRPWILFVALGITGIAAGTVALWIGEDSELPPKTTGLPIASLLTSPSKTPTLPPLGGPRKSYPGPTLPELGTLSDRMNAAQPSPVASTSPATVAPPTTRPAISRAMWDEDLIGPEEGSLGPDETWDADPSVSGGRVAERMPTDAVLRQLDEIEASLRKKPAAARSK
jgi:hypothetical protein